MFNFVCIPPSSRITLTVAMETVHCFIVRFSLSLGQKFCCNSGVPTTKTCPCNITPLIPHFYIAKLGYAGVYLFFLLLLQNIDCGKKNIKNFQLKFFNFLRSIAWASFRNAINDLALIKNCLGGFKASQISHYENTPMQYTEMFLVVKIKIFTGKILIFFLFLLKT